MYRHRITALLCIMLVENATNDFKGSCDPVILPSGITKVLELMLGVENFQIYKV